MATHMSDNQLERLYKQLDDISSGMQAMQRDIHGVVRLQEQVNNHTETLKRFGNDVDNVKSRVHKVEIWQAERNNNDYLDYMMTGVSEKITAIEKKIDKLESTNDEQNKTISTNHFSITKSALAWVAAILSALIIFAVTYTYKGK